LTIILTNIGFEPNQEQSSETIKALKSLMSIIPLIGVCISFALLYFYPIDKNFHEKLIQDIENRRALDV
jgi:Na+/melibiose symporter-like transporter